MISKKENILPQTQNYLNIVGEQIRLARRRRNISASIVAQRAGVCRQTVSKIEKGDSSVSMGAYAAVLHAIDGMDKDLLLIAQKDRIGHDIQDSKL